MPVSTHIFSCPSVPCDLARGFLGTPDSDLERFPLKLSLKKHSSSSAPPPASTRKAGMRLAMASSSLWRMKNAVLRHTPHFSADSRSGSMSTWHSANLIQADLSSLVVEKMRMVASVKVLAHPRQRNR